MTADKGTRTYYIPTAAKTFFQTPQWVSEYRKSAENLQIKCCGNTVTVTSDTDEWIFLAECDADGQVKKEVYCLPGEDGELHIVRGTVLERSDYGIKTIEYSDGKVDAVTEEEYDGRGNITKLVTRDADGNIRSDTKYEHDAKGILTKRYNHEFDGNIYGTDCTYDENGNSISEHHYCQFPDGSFDPRIDTHLTREYDGKNRIKKTHLYTHTSVSHGDYEYDENGREIKNTFYDEDGNVTRWYEYSYNAAGNLTKMLAYEKDVGTYIAEALEYDQNGNIKKAVHNVDPKQGSFAVTEYIYDENGNRTAQIISNPSSALGVVCTEERYAYDYRSDAEGILMKYCRSENGRTVRSAEITAWQEVTATAAQYRFYKYICLADVFCMEHGEIDQLLSEVYAFTPIR